MQKLVELACIKFSLVGDKAVAPLSKQLEQLSGAISKKLNAESPMVEREDKPAITTGLNNNKAIAINHAQVFPEIQPEQKGAEKKSKLK